MFDASGCLVLSGRPDEPRPDVARTGGSAYLRSGFKLYGVPGDAESLAQPGGFAGVRGFANRRLAAAGHSDRIPRHALARRGYWRSAGWARASQTRPGPGLPRRAHGALAAISSRSTGPSTRAIESREPSRSLQTIPVSVIR